MKRVVKNQHVGIFSLDESQLRGSIAAAKFYESLPADQRYTEENIKKADAIALKVRDEYRAKNGKSKEENIALDIAQGTEPQQAQRVDPNEVILRRYLRALTRLQCGKIDSPEYDVFDYAELLVLSGMKEDCIAPSPELFYARLQQFLGIPEETEEEKEEEEKPESKPEDTAKEEEQPKP